MNLATDLNCDEVAEQNNRPATRALADVDSLYLDRCQVDTPPDIVKILWSEVAKRRKEIGDVIDFGAGDGRFAFGAQYRSYVGYEIDASRIAGVSLPDNATVLNRCAFLDEISTADLCVGNPPYVRNQDLPEGWRARVSRILHNRLDGVKISGLANAWQYFFFLSLISTKHDGLVAIVIPYEWVSRPAAKALREYIKAKGWNVTVIRLLDSTFDQVLTTASITIVDKRGKKGEWKYFSENENSEFVKIESACNSPASYIPYKARRVLADKVPYFKRGLSPGTQEVLVLTETERLAAGLKINIDVVPCVTSLRILGLATLNLTPHLFAKKFVSGGAKCWLVRTDVDPSPRLARYFAAVPFAKYQTATCKNRTTWWKFSMPEIPSALVASGFRGARPKIVENTVCARAVGGVSGLYGLTKAGAKSAVRKISQMDVSSRIVSHAHGLLKLEINQLNFVLDQILPLATPIDEDISD